MSAEAEERLQCHGEDGGGPQVEREQEGKGRMDKGGKPGTFRISLWPPSSTPPSLDHPPHLLVSAWAQESGFLKGRMNDENDEKECENVNERCVNMNKILQKCVTKPGPDNLLEQNLKRIMSKKPQKYQVDPCLLYTSPSPRDRSISRMPSSA